MQFVEHPQRIRARLDELMAAHRAKKYPFTPAAMISPCDEDQLPPSLPRGGVDEANYYVAMCNYMLGAADSITMAQMLSGLYENYHDRLFDWSAAASLKPASVCRVLQDTGLNFRATRVAEAWVENAQRINRRYLGDIRNAFVLADGNWEHLYEELVRTRPQDGLVGFQAKMASMLAFYLMKRQLVDYFTVPPQVDFHVLRVFWATEMIVPCDDNGKPLQSIVNQEIIAYANAIRRCLVRYEIETGQNWLYLSEALWTQSRALCKLSPSNSVKKSVDLEAGYEEIWQEPIQWTPTQRARYRKGCGRCAIEPSCKNAIPSGFYYGRNITELRNFGLRQKPPPENGQLFNPD